MHTGDRFPGLRTRLSELGFSPFDITLPGEAEDVAPLEGALRLSETAEGWALETVDYGQGFVVGTSSSESGVPGLVTYYLSREIPHVRAVTRSEVDELVAPVAQHYFDVRDRAAAAGNDGIVIDLPVGLPLDRLGAMDGVHLYPIDTPFELRSLPPHVLRPESDVHQFVTAEPIRVNAVITAPWFGRPGGGLRFTLQGRLASIRNLAVQEKLERIHVTK